MSFSYRQWFRDHVAGNTVAGILVVLLTSAWLTGLLGDLWKTAVATMSGLPRLLARSISLPVGGLLVVAAVLVLLIGLAYSLGYAVASPPLAAPKAEPQTPEPPEPQLDELQKKIMKLFAEYAGHPLVSSVISRKLRVPGLRVDDALERLLDIEYLDSAHDEDEATLYSLSRAGRSYVVRKNLI